MLTAPDHQVKSEKYNKTISILVIIALACKFIDILLTDSLHLNVNTFMFTELLINFSGGFVRRGLFGDILHSMCTATGIAPQYFVVPFCILVYLAVCAFFFIKFKRRNYSWWYLASPLLLGFMASIVRKDFMLYGLTIISLYCLHTSKEALWKNTIVLMLGVLGLFLHEAYIFFGLPVLALILMKQRQYRLFNIAIIACWIFVFLILCKFKGDAEIAKNIYASWQPLIPELVDDSKSSIGAIGWETIPTIIMHVRFNLGLPYTVLGFAYWPVLFLIGYYFFTFFLKTFRLKNGTYSKEEQTSLSCLLIFVSICLLPMYIGLSCDYGRLFQYGSITALSAFLVIPSSTLHALFPNWFRTIIAGLNSHLEKYISPSRGIMLFLLFMFSYSHCYFDPYNAMTQSLYGGTFQALFDAVYSLIH